jgi:hypothetical protein
VTGPRWLASAGRAEVKFLQNESNFRTTVTVFLPGQVQAMQTYDNVKEFTLGERRIQFILEDGRSVTTNLPFFLERTPIK